ncbi:hypothetical protein GJ496_004453 [Pomphorhynchus laevis]|nr:hypothetical protein GJ496_004453 [Pomphorhynchus laevis]
MKFALLLIAVLINCAFQRQYPNKRQLSNVEAALRLCCCGQPLYNTQFQSMPQQNYQSPQYSTDYVQSQCYQQNPVHTYQGVLFPQQNVETNTGLSIPPSQLQGPIASANILESNTQYSSQMPSYPEIQQPDISLQESINNLKVVSCPKKIYSPSSLPNIHSSLSSCVANNNQQLKQQHEQQQLQPLTTTYSPTSCSTVLGLILPIALCPERLCSLLPQSSQFEQDQSLSSSSYFEKYILNKKPNPTYQAPITLQSYVIEKQSCADTKDATGIQIIPQIANKCCVKFPKSNFVSSSISYYDQLETTEAKPTNGEETSKCAPIFINRIQSNLNKYLQGSKNTQQFLSPYKSSKQKVISQSVPQYCTCE